MMATAKGPRTQRYRPACEFDNATLAKKREYWRTKKREQRAKVAAVNKKVGGQNAAVVCDATRPNASGSHVAQNSMSRATLLNNDGSYHTNPCDSSESNPCEPSLESGVSLASGYNEPGANADGGEGEASGGCVAGPSSRNPQNASSTAGQRVRWFHNMKLNQVLPKFPDGLGASQDGAATTMTRCGKAEVRMPSTTTGPSFAPTSSATSNGSLPSGSPAPVPAVRVSVRPPMTSVNHRPPPSRTATANRSLPCNQSFSAKASSGLGDNRIRPQVQAQSPYKAAPLSVTNKAGVCVKQCPSGVRGANTKTITTPPRALGPKTSVLPDGGGMAAVPETEEERAARRREVWRIKKREQRANKAARLASEKERESGPMPAASVPGRQAAVPRGPVCVDLNSPSSWKGQQGQQRQAVHRYRVPAAPLQRHNHTVTVTRPGLSRVPGPGRGPISKSTNPALTNTPPQSNCITIDDDPVLPPPPQVVVKTGDLKQSRAYFTPSSATSATAGTRVASNNMNLGPGVSYASRVVTGPPFPNTLRTNNTTTTTTTIIRPRTQTNKLMRSQRFLGQRNTWAMTATSGSYSSSRSSFSSFPPFRENPNETPEEKMARKREYWRTKKREQRARLSTEVKAKLRERDSLLRRVKRYQGILEDMRRARQQTATACQKGQSQTGNTARVNAGTNTSSVSIGGNSVGMNVAGASTNVSGMSIGGGAGSGGGPLPGEPIGGFIKEDGTVTVSVPTTVSPSGVGTNSGVEKVSTLNLLPPPLITRGQVTTSRGRGFTGGARGFGGSRGFGCRVNLNPPPLQRRAAQMRNTHPVRVSVQPPPKLVCVRPRGAAMLNSHQNRSTSQIPPHGSKMVSESAFNRGGGQGMNNSASNLRRTSTIAVARPMGRTVRPNPNDNTLTEEQRIAQRREYWRIKKREQRANRAARLRQGMLRGRALAARRRRQYQNPNQNRIPELSPSTGNHTTTTFNTTNTTNTAASTAAAPPFVTVNAGSSNHLEPRSMHTLLPRQKMKTEKDDANCPLEGQPLCDVADVKTSLLRSAERSHSGGEPPASRGAGTDGQSSTTLLAVASMKKLLEESLCTVENSDMPETTTKTTTIPVAANIKREVPSLCKAEAEDPLPVEGDMMMMAHIKPDPAAFQPDPPVFQPDLASFQQRSSSVEASDLSAAICFSVGVSHLHANDNSNSGSNSPPPLSHFPPPPSSLPPLRCSQDVPPPPPPPPPPPQPMYAPSSPSASCSLGQDTMTSPTSAPAPPIPFCSPHKPPTCPQTLMHLTSPHTTQQQQQQQVSQVPCTTRSKVRPYCAALRQPESPGLRQRKAPGGSGGGTSLQKKREYWKFMKRQQRARKAQEMRGLPAGSPGTRTHQAPNFASGPQRPVHTSYRTPSLPLHKPLPTACALQSRTRLSPVPHPSPPDHIPNYSSRQQQSLHPYGLSPSDRSLDVNAQDQSPKERCAAHSSFPSCCLEPPPPCTPPGGIRDAPPSPGQQCGAPLSVTPSETPPSSSSSFGGPLLLVESHRDSEGEGEPSHIPGVRRWCLQEQGGGGGGGDGGGGGGGDSSNTPPHHHHHDQQQQQQPSPVPHPSCVSINASAHLNHQTAKPVRSMGPPLHINNDYITTNHRHHHHNNTRWSANARHAGGLMPRRKGKSAVVDDEEVMRQKREYWRTKKKEQRARKAAREKGLEPVMMMDSMGHPQHLPSTDQLPPWQPGDMDMDIEQGLPNTQHQLPHDAQSQDSKQWFKEEADMAVSSSMDPDLGYYGMSSQAEHVQDNTDMAYQKYPHHHQHHDDDGDCTGPVSVDDWRSSYLMDYDPATQLLVCMVCGEQQYSYSPEGARAHIEEAHPDTLSLGQQQRQRMQEAWDLQVAQREQFFTSQLQQRSSVPHAAGTVAEVEVTVDMEDPSEYSKSAKTKNMRKF